MTHISAFVGNAVVSMGPVVILRVFDPYSHSYRYSSGVVAIGVPVTTVA